MLRAHKIRLNPTEAQITYFKKASGVSRFSYNWMLGEWKNSRDVGNKKSVKELKKDLNHAKTENFPWMYEVTKCAVEYAIIDLRRAFSNYYKNKKHFKFPKFKAKKREPMRFGVDNLNFDVNGHELKIANLDTPINMAEELRFSGKLMSCRISYRAGHWYAAITVDVPRENPPMKVNSDNLPTQERAVGIDLGLKTFATLSNGQKFENQKHLEKAQKHVARLQRKLARSAKGGKNREKIVLRLGRVYERVTNLRGEQFHQIAGDILKQDFDLIGIENLNVKGMMKNKKLARNIADVAWSQFKWILTYKAAQKGVVVVDVGRFFPSSQICNECHHQNHALTLNDREWDCPNCGKHHDRDFNAASNIRNKSVRLFLKGIVDAKKQSSVTAVVSPDVKCLV